MKLGNHLLTHWSRTQSSIALSSGEAELNAMLKGGCESLCLRNLLKEVGVDADIEMFGDSSASYGTLHRIGAGKMKHLHTKQLWLQERVQCGDVHIYKVDRSQNWSDALTHPWTPSDLPHFTSMGVESVA